MGLSTKKQDTVLQEVGTFPALMSDTWIFPPRSRIPFYKRWVLFQHS
jgi:hypothetical protein